MSFLEKVRDYYLDCLPIISDPCADHEIVCPCCNGLIGIQCPHENPPPYGQRRTGTAWCYWCAKYFSYEY